MKMNLNREQTGKLQRLIKKYKYLKDFFRRERPDAVVAFLFNMEAPAILAGLATHTRIFTSVRNTAWAYPKRERQFRKLFYPKIAGVVFQSKTVQHYVDFKKLKNCVFCFFILRTMKAIQDHLLLQYGCYQS